MKFTLRTARTLRDRELVSLLDTVIFGRDGCELIQPFELNSADVIWRLAYTQNSVNPVGFCGMALSSKYTTSFIRAGVLQEYRRQGLQKQMIMSRLQIAKKLGYTNVQTYVHGDNVASTKALLSCGFIPHKASNNRREGLWLYVQASTADIEQLWPRRTSK